MRIPDLEIRPAGLLPGPSVVNRVGVLERAESLFLIDDRPLDVRIIRNTEYLVQDPRSPAVNSPLRDKTGSVWGINGRN